MKNWRKIAGRAALWIGVAAWFALFIILAFHHKRSQQPWEGFEKPDDIRIARELFAGKFAGPRYFQFEETANHLPFPYISVSEARRQIAGIVKARRLPPDAEEKLERLIDALTEPAASRVFAANRVNTLQLNLALDSEK